MHHVSIRSHIVDRVLARRGKFHWFEQLDPSRTALLVIDMQSTFCEPGSPAEVPASRSIVAPINALTQGLRALGVPVFWVLHANTQMADKSDWEMFFNHVVADVFVGPRYSSKAPASETGVFNSLSGVFTSTTLLDIPSPTCALNKEGVLHHNWLRG